MGMLSRVVAVLGLVLAGTVVVVATGTPAGAAVVPCTQTFTQTFTGAGGHVPEGQTRPFGVTVPDGAFLPGATVGDVDFRVAFSDARGTTLSLAAGGVMRRLLSADGLGYAPHDLTFDDEAASPWSPGAAGGRYRPTESVDAFDGRAAAGQWTLVANATFGLSGLFVESVSVTITTSGCDSDGDGAPETVDNCPSTVNADQLDWDADRAGNACDSTPGTAPAPPAPPAPITTSVPGCSASCVYERTVELRHLARKGRLVGSVASVASGCQSGVPVTIWRQRSGADRQLVVLTSRYSGSFRTKAPRKPGRYYATVGSAGEPLCGAGQSPTVRVRRR
ncbi:hypothetical protein GCM10023339_08190 [Alloalcanivorax gelatiniphagus]